MVVGSWKCLTSPGPAGPPDDAGLPTPLTDAVAVPWSSGFEDGFCGYEDAKGFCYAHQGAAYTSVLSPVHSGRRAAAFSLDLADAGSEADARCVREGSFPHDAYYGAWFYVPSVPQKTTNWNLIFFQGGSGDRDGWQKLWNVTLVSIGAGKLGLNVFDILNNQGRGPDNPREIPIGAWFHVVFRLVRSAGTDGEVTLYQGDEQHEDQPLVDVTGIRTDPSEFDQWYVGNLADAATPSDLTLYVDDVSISTTLH